jgi:hypothetical protein
VSDSGFPQKIGRILIALWSSVNAKLQKTTRNQQKRTPRELPEALTNNQAGQ